MGAPKKVKVYSIAWQARKPLLQPKGVYGNRAATRKTAAGFSREKAGPAFNISHSHATRAEIIVCFSFFYGLIRLQKFFAGIS
jgi:hypothetical protein